jgi:hypothetical protein
MGHGGGPVGGGESSYTYVTCMYSSSQEQNRVMDPLEN